MLSPLADLDSSPNPAQEQTNEFDLKNLPSAPRDVSFLAALTLVLKSGYGLLFLASSLFFLLIFGVGAALYDDFGVWEPYATGRVVSCDYTNVSVNGRTSLAIAFEGQVPGDAATFTGVSYSFSSMTPGEEVAIERRRGSTDVLRVEGAALTILGASQDHRLLVAILLLVVAAAALWGVILPFCAGLGDIKTLQRGEATYGSLASIRETAVRVNRVPVHLMTFNFVTNSFKESVASARTLHPEEFRKLPNYPILYLPERPEKAIVLNSLSDKIKLKPNVGFVARLKPLIPRLFLAAVVIVEIVLFFNAPNEKHHAVFSAVESAAATVDANEAPAQFDETEQSRN